MRSLLTVLMIVGGRMFINGPALALASTRTVT